jgi:uncharacterized protein (TIGR01777 family)
MRHYVITGATGLIGSHLVKHWLNQKHEVSVIGRTNEHIEKQYGHSVRALTWDKLTSDDLKPANVVVNLAGAGIGDKSWNNTYKKEIESSRVNATHQIVQLLLELKQSPPRLINASAIGIYGLQQQSENSLPPAMDENTAIQWGKPKDFLSHIGQEWEKAAAPAAGMNVVFTRFGVVLAQEGGALPKLAMPFKFFLGGPVGSGHQPFSWVAIDDVVRAIDFLANQPEASGPYNIVAPQCVQQHVFASALAKVLHRPDWLSMPGFVMKRMLGSEMATELLLEGQHVYPRRLLEAGFTFQYADIQSALQHLLIEGEKQ